MIAKMFPQRMDCLVMMNFRMPERPSILMTVTPTGFHSSIEAQNLRLRNK